MDPALVYSQWMQSRQSRQTLCSNVPILIPAGRNANRTAHRQGPRQAVLLDVRGLRYYLNRVSPRLRSFVAMVSATDPREKTAPIAREIVHPPAAMVSVVWTRRQVPVLQTAGRLVLAAPGRTTAPARRCMSVEAPVAAVPGDRDVSTASARIRKIGEQRTEGRC